VVAGVLSVATIFPLADFQGGGGRFFRAVNDLTGYNRESGAEMAGKLF
jgi:hypothetical protein